MNTVLDLRTNLSTRMPESRALDQILIGLDELAAKSDYLIRKPFGEFTSGTQSYQIPRYIFLGPRGGGDTIRIGVFATIHGDEPQGAFAIAQLAAALERNPELARGYGLFFYPICNPTGFEDKTRCSRTGKDLNREFWKNSSEPEVQYLETEIWTHAFHGIVNLHADDTSHGVYGFVNGGVLSKHLLEPALQAAEEHLPRNHDREIDGFPAEGGIVYECYNGVLQAPVGLQSPPFEVTLETPHPAPLASQVNAFESALQRILLEYRAFLSIAQNI